GLSGDPLSPLTHPPMPPQPLGLSGPLIGAAMNKLGWHWWPSDTTVATTDYEGRARCINLGHCTPACAQGAKDRKSTRLNSSPTEIYTLSLHDALPIWHWWPSDTTVATTDYEGRARCINLGHCTPACAQGA